MKTLTTKMTAHATHIPHHIRLSAWNCGVQKYQEELTAFLQEAFENGDIDIRLDSPSLDTATVQKWLLNGAENWSQYSYDGHSLIYDGDIAARLCTPSEYQKRHGGDYAPRRGGNWLDVQAKALYQAAAIVATQVSQNYSALYDDVNGATYNCGLLIKETEYIKKYPDRVIRRFVSKNGNNCIEYRYHDCDANDWKVSVYTEYTHPVMVLDI